jgi:Spy/CpxP family protein refolding chaperone
MTKTRLLIVVCFLVAFAAGISGGLAFSRRPRERPRPPLLVEQLDLTAEQAEQARDIWSETREALRADMAGRRDALQQERDDAIRALLTEEQRVRYEQVMADYRSKREELRNKRKAAIEKAVERTKEILTDEQRAKYDQLLEERRKQGGLPWGRGPHRSPRGGASGAPRQAPQSEE